MHSDVVISERVEVSVAQSAHFAGVGAALAVVHCQVDGHAFLVGCERAVSTVVHLALLRSKTFRLV